MAKVETVLPSLSDPSLRSRPAGLEVDLTAAGLIGVGWLLLAHTVLLRGGDVWSAGLFGSVMLVIGVGLLRRACWARRLTLWLFLLGLVSLFAGLWRLDDLLHGLNALRGVASLGAVPRTQSPVLTTDEALLIVLAYWGVGWCAWRLGSRATSRHFEAQAELRRLRKAGRSQRRSPST